MTKGIVMLSQSPTSKLKERIARGETYIAQRQAQGLPTGKAETLLAELKAEHRRAETIERAYTLADKVNDAMGAEGC